LLPQIAYLIVRLSQSNEPKIQIQKQKSHELLTPFHLFSYIKSEMRDKEEKEERNKKQRRETEEIKIEIRPSQLQTAITFDRKLRLRRAMRSQKAYDEIYRVNTYCCFHHFRGQIISS
jgi:hypothetical protein